MESLTEMKDYKRDCRSGKLSSQALHRRRQPSGPRLQGMSCVGVRPFDLTDSCAPLGVRIGHLPTTHGPRVELNPSIQDNREKGVMI